MKTLRNCVLLAIMTCMLGSCSFFQNIFGGGGGKNGCPSNGSNVGAEKLMDGYKPKNKEEKKAIDRAKKAKLKTDS